MGWGDTWGGATHVAPPTPIPLVYTANLIGVDPSMCIPLCTILYNWFGHITEILCANSRIICLNLNYNLFSKHGNFSQMKSLFTNKLLMTAPPGSFIHISLRIGRPRISTKVGFYTHVSPRPIVQGALWSYSKIWQRPVSWILIRSRWRC